MTKNIRVIGTLKGNIETKPADHIKYGLMFEALAQLVQLVDIYDTTLKGPGRWLNALRAFHPDRHQWRERFYQNVPAFKARSQQTVTHLRQRQKDFDLIFQVGVLYDARWNNIGKPSIIYTDYTAFLSRQKRDSGRSPFTEAQSQMWLEMEKHAFEHASHICARAEYVRRSIVENYGIAAEKVTTIGGGVGFANLPVLDSIKQNTQRPPTALFIGKDFYRKGGDILLRAFAQTHQTLPEIQLKMVTQAPSQLDLPLEGVELIPPTWDRTVIEKLFQTADVFVLPSRLETWGDVLLEAMAYGIPCIGVSGEAMGDIIAHEQTGLVVPPQDVEALAGGLITLLGNQQLQTTWGLAGRRRLEEHFTWATVMQKLTPIIERINQAN